MPGPSKPETSEKISVFLAKPKELERIAIASILRGTDKPFTIAGQATTGKDAVQLIRELKPQVALIGICFTDMLGTDVAKVVRQVSPATKLMILTRGDCIDHLLAAFDAGADGYYPTDATPEELTAAVRAVSDGACCIAPSIALKIMEVCKVPQNHPVSIISGTSAEGCFGLSARELQVLGLIIEGLSNQEIAAQMTLRETTVKSHVRKILDKLSVSGRTEAAVKAVKGGVLECSCYLGL